MRGQDAADDWAAIVREQGGLRENPLEPEQSLLLLNATEGGSLTTRWKERRCSIGCVRALRIRPMRRSLWN
jgi:hypothetical protein